MKPFLSKQEAILVLKWDGDDDEATVHELRNAGWKVVFQQPETPEMDVWEWEDEEARKVPTPARMIIIGGYRGQLWTIDAGRYLGYRKGDGDFRNWSDRDLVDHWDADTTAPEVTIPTPQALYEERQGKVEAKLAIG
jgi:hypothetical protein